MRYLWRLGGDSRCVTPAAANAAAGPTFGQAEVGDDQAGDVEAAKVSAAAGPVTRSAASWQPHSMISTQSGAAPRRLGCVPFM